MAIERKSERKQKDCYTKGYEDVFCEEALRGLPFIRGFRHQIDFVPRASNPNRLMHSSNPEKTKELQGQANKTRHKLVFDPGDWVWLCERKKRIPTEKRSKLLPRGNGPFQVLERIDENAYKSLLGDDFLFKRRGMM